MRLVGRGLFATVVAFLVCGPARAEAAPISISAGLLSPGTFNFGGTFGTDNDVALIYFSLAGTSDLTAQMTSHVATPAGFDPILTLFGAGTDFLGGFDYLTDTDTGLLLATLAAGNYLLAVTQFNNYYTPGNGFDYDAAVNGQFTSALFGPAAGCSAFVAYDGSCRSPQFAGTLSLPTQAVPEPGTLALVVCGGAALVGWHRRQRARAPKRRA
jgi:hypothetical protein